MTAAGTDGRGETTAQRVERIGVAWPQVTLQQGVQSSVPGMTGSWMMTFVMRLPRVPVAGDYVTWNDDWASERVKDVFLSRTGCHVVLYPCVTDNPAILGDLGKMLTLGWRQVSGPWEVRRRSERRG